MKRHSSPLVFTNGLTVMLNILACYISSFFLKKFYFVWFVLLHIFLEIYPKKCLQNFFKIYQQKHTFLFSRCYLSSLPPFTDKSQKRFLFILSPKPFSPIQPQLVYSNLDSAELTLPNQPSCSLNIRYHVLNVFLPEHSLVTTCLQVIICCVAFWGSFQSRFSSLH